jgi:calcium/calmodulin-dependent protein kinase I
VSKAISLEDGSIVAIKKINKKVPHINIDNIKKEIRIMKLCKHKNIVQLIDVFEDKESIYIVMEYLSGGDLYARYCSKEYHFKEERVRTIFKQILDAVRYMQELGIIHRDLKLENILFENEIEDSNIKIADFGLSALQGPFQDATDVLGTLHYVAPEVLANKPYDYSVDLWSLGVILFVLVTGCYPFDALNCQTEKK